MIVEPNKADTAPELVMLEPPFNVIADAVRVIVPVLLLVIGDGLLPMMDDDELATIFPELVKLVPPAKFNTDDVNVIVPVLLLVMVVGLPVLIPVEELELRLPLLTKFPPEAIERAPLKVMVLFAPVVSVDGLPTDDTPPKVAEPEPAKVR